jgi:hypothetical protein
MLLSMECGFVRPTDQECFQQCIWDSIVPEVAIKQIGQLCRNHGNDGKKQDLHTVVHSYLGDNQEGHQPGGGQFSKRKQMIVAAINFGNPCWFGIDSKGPLEGEN